MKYKYKTDALRVRYCHVIAVTMMAKQTDETFATLSVMYEYSGDAVISKHLVRRTADQSSKNVVNLTERKTFSLPNF